MQKQIIYSWLVAYLKDYLHLEMQIYPVVSLPLMNSYRMQTMTPALNCSSPRICVHKCESTAILSKAHVCIMHT